MAVGMKLEVINVHAKGSSSNNVYWIATVIRLEGIPLSCYLVHIDRDFIFFRLSGTDAL
jgi:hypothetical protein